MEWNAAQYLKFGRERTQACRDLAQRVAARTSAESVHRIADLGCGPGNSTAVLAGTFPHAEEIVGLDNSAIMLAEARRMHPGLRFLTADITAWAMNERERYDVVFSNAALQWVADHDRLIPQLLARVAVGGVLAFQMPASWAVPVRQLPQRLAASPEWRRYFPIGGVREWHSHELDFYYDLLTAPPQPPAAIDLWETEYVHIMENAEAIVEWYRGSGLRPYLQALPGEEERREFLGVYLDGVRRAYPARADGRILFSFRRRFLVAQRGGNPQS